MTEQIAKPAAQSRTLRFNRLAMVWTSVLAVLPSLLGWLVDLVGDPTIGAAVSNMIPTKYRVLALAIVAYMAQKNRQHRLQTTQPIAKGSDAVVLPARP